MLSEPGHLHRSGRDLSSSAILGRNSAAFLAPPTTTISRGTARTQPARIDPNTVGGPTLPPGHIGFPFGKCSRRSLATSADGFPGGGGQKSAGPATSTRPNQLARHDHCDNWHGKPLGWHPPSVQIEFVHWVNQPGLRRTQMEAGPQSAFSRPRGDHQDAHQYGQAQLRISGASSPYWRV